MAGIPTLEECRPGMRATGFCLLIAVEPVEEVTKGGIILTSSTTDKESQIQTRGRIISMSPAAFDFANFPEDAVPKVGDAVVFSKLAGVRLKGADGKELRIIQDRDVCAIIEENK